MRYGGGNPLKYQDKLEALRTSPLNAMECGLFYMASPLLTISR
jgi:hypothetical protein